MVHDCACKELTPADIHLTPADMRVFTEFRSTPRFMPALIRSVALQDYEWAAQAVAVDPYAQMKRLGLVLEQPISGDEFIPYQLFVQLLENTAEAGRCPDFGLRMGQGPDEYFEGPVVVLMRHANTLSEALALITQYGHVYSTVFQPTLAPVRGQAGMVDLILTVNDGRPASFKQVTEYILVSLVRALRFARESRGDDLLVMFPHEALSAADKYQAYFSCECRFNAPFAAIRIAEAELKRPLPGRNELRIKMATSYIDSRFPKSGELVSEGVRRLLRQRLGMGRVKQADIAAELSLHEKSLQRRLAREGCPFPQLLDEARRDYFVELLRQSARPSLAQIALMLGYSEQAALSRSCQRWFACSPSELLQRH